MDLFSGIAAFFLAIGSLFTPVPTTFGNADVFYPDTTGPHYVIDIDDGCAEWSSNVLTSTGVGCGTGGGGSGVATSSLAATYPITLTTSSSAITYGFNGLSTTSPWTGSGVAWRVSDNQVSTVATTSLTASSPLALSQPISVIGSSASALSIDTSGTWSGNAGTATALAANGANCSSGSAPLGVDASGAAESCFDVWTESENTAANYEQALTAGDGLTRTGDDFDCDTASGSVFGCLTSTDWNTFNGKLSSYDAWTHPSAAQSATTSLLITTGGVIVNAASSTVTNAVLGNATTTNATTSILNISSLLTFGGVTGNSWDDFCTSITGSSDLCDGSDATGAGGADWPFTPATHYGTSTQSTTTPLWLRGNQYSLFASSTSVFDNASTTQLTVGTLYNAGSNILTSTLTDGSITLLSTGSGSVSINSSNVSNYVSASNNGILLEAGGGFTVSTDNSNFATLDFDGSNATYTFPNTSGTICLVGFACDGSGGTSFGQAWEITGGYLAPTTTIGVIVSASSTITSLTTINSTSTNATTTNLNVSGQLDIDGLTSALVLTGAGGIAAEYAGTSCTNQVPTALSALGAATCTTITSAYVDSSIITTASTLDSLAQTTLSDPAADQLVFWDDSDTAFEFISALSGLAISGNTLTVNDVTCTDCLTSTEIADEYLLNNGDVGTGVYDFGGATSLEIPNGGPTVDTTGEVGVDTTSGQFKWSYSGSSLGIKLPYEELGFGFASSSQGAATTTLRLGPAPHAITVTSAQCDFSNFMGISLYDGTNRADYFVASSTIGTITFTSNNTFTAGEAVRVDVGTSTNIAAAVSGGCTFKYTNTAD